MNTTSIMMHRARARRAALVTVAGAAAALAAASATAQVSNQPGESDLFQRSGEGFRTTRTSATVRETGATYRETTTQEHAATKQAKQPQPQQQPVTYQQASYQQAASSAPTQPATPPAQSMYTRGDRTLGGWDDGRLQPSMGARPVAVVYRLEEPRLIYANQPEPWAMNLPPASPEYISDFSRPSNNVMEVRGTTTQPRATTSTVSHRTTETRDTGTRITPAADTTVSRRNRGALSYGDVDYYSQIGYGDFTYYSDFQKAPHYPEPAQPGRRTRNVRSETAPQVTPATTTQYRSSDTTYYTNDPDVDMWLENTDR